MGGGTEIVQPTPPAQPTAGESAEDFAKALPQILEAQLQYQPEFDRATLESFRELAPQYADIARQTMERFSPTLASLDESLAKQALTMSQEGLSAEEQDFYKRQFKDLVGEQASSGLGASFVAKNLLGQDIARRDLGRNLALSLQGKVPVSQAFQNPSSYQVANAFQPAYGTQMSGFGSVFSGAGRPLGYETGADRFATIAGGVGGLMQGAASLIKKSSAALKKDIVDVKDGLETLEKIRPVNYKWINNNQDDGGVIAEEIEKIIPECVTSVNGVKHIKPMMIIGYIIKAVQELSKKIEDKELSHA